MSRHRALYSTIDQLVPPIPARSALFALPIDVIVYLIGKLELMRISPVWAPGEDTRTGYNLLGETIMALIQPITGMEDIYRFLDTNMRGTEYTYAVVDGENIISPDIPIVPVTTDTPLIPMLAHMQELSNMLITGDAATITITSDMSLQSRLQAVIDAINSSDTDITTIISELTSIAGLLA